VTSSYANAEKKRKKKKKKKKKKKEKKKLKYLVINKENQNSSFSATGDHGVQRVPKSTSETSSSINRRTTDSVVPRVRKDKAISSRQKG